MKKEKRYKLEVSEEQLRVIAQALEDVSRISSGQLTMAKVFGGTLHENYKDDFETFLKQRTILDRQLEAIKATIRPNLAVNASYGYNATEYIGNTYQLYRTMFREINRGNGNVYDSEPLPSGTLGTLKIEEIKQ